MIRAADGIANKQIAAELGVTLMKALFRPRRFASDLVAGLRNAPRAGRRPTTRALTATGSSR